jgi:S1-C subfamily serine protease
MTLSRPSRCGRAIIGFTGLLMAIPICAQGNKSKVAALSAMEIFKRALPSVVAMDCMGPNGVRISTASGFIVSDNGRILTSFHVIQNCASMSVRLSNGDAYDSVNVVDSDERKDIALVRIKAVSLPVIALGDSDAIQVGQKIYSIGNPSGLQNTLQEGLVSGTLPLPGYRLMQVSASLNPGNSGGPILNDRCQVVGITKSKISTAENLGFAVPINYAKGLSGNENGNDFRRVCQRDAGGAGEGGGGQDGRRQGQICDGSNSESHRGPSSGSSGSATHAG